MEPFEAYQLYMAVRSHFTSKYDFQKYRGKMRTASFDTFLKRRDRIWFTKLAKKKEPLGFLLAQIEKLPYGHNLWIGDLVGTNGDGNYREWKGRQESLEYNFTTEVRDIFTRHQDTTRAIYSKTPGALQDYVSKKVSAETLCILDQVFAGKMFPYWKENCDDEFFLVPMIKQLENYSPFISVKIVKFVDIYEENAPK